MVVVRYYRVREGHAQAWAWHVGNCLVGALNMRRGLQTGGSWKGLKEEMRKGLICQQSLGILSPGQNEALMGFKLGSDMARVLCSGFRVENRMKGTQGEGQKTS